MASPEVLEIEQIVAPIPGDVAAGSDLRADPSPMSVYYQIKDTRNTARAAERQAMMDGELDAGADWSPIIHLAPAVLAEQSKDLEVVAYLIEALAREEGFAGLRDGFRLTRRLVEEFGDSIYPLPDEDGDETRLGPLTGLNGADGDGTLIGPIGNIPLTDRTSVGALGTVHYEQALELERAEPEVRERRISQGAVSMEMIRTAVDETDGPFFQSVLEDIRQAEAEFASLTQVLDERYGEFSPPSSNTRKALQRCRETLESIARDKLALLAPQESDEEALADAESEAAAEAGTTAAPQKPPGAIENRDDAFRQILKIAEYFRRTEPHTPISYALENVVRWGRLPLPELMKELITDDSTISQMFRMVGIRPTEKEQEDRYE